MKIPLVTEEIRKRKTSFKEFVHFCRYLYTIFDTKRLYAVQETIIREGS